jgi:hypothetical protein
MSKHKQRRPTTRELKKDIAILVKEVFELKRYINEVLAPFITSNINLLEKYLEYKGDIEHFIEYIKKEFGNEKRAVNESPKDGEKKQAKGSGAPEAVSKDVSEYGTGSVQ